MSGNKLSTSTELINADKSMVNSILLAQHTVYKKYLAELKDYSVVKPDEKLLQGNQKDCLRFIKLNEFTRSQGEDVFQKLSTVYSSCTALGCSVVVMINVKKRSDPVDFYIGVRRQRRRSSDSDMLVSFDALKNGLKSNFPGTKTEDMHYTKKLEPLLQEIFGETCTDISAVSCVASARDKSKTENKHFVQGLERFVDAMRGHAYTALFIAEPIGSDEQTLIRNGYETIYSTLSPFRKTVISYNQSESNSVMNSLAHSISESVSEGTNHTQAQTQNWSVNSSESSSSTASNSQTYTKSNSKTTPTTSSRVGSGIVAASGALGSISTVCSLLPAGPNIIAGVAGMALSTIGGTVGGMMAGTNTSDSTSKAISSSISKTIGCSSGKSFGEGNTESVGTSTSVTKGNSDTITEGTTNTNTIGQSMQLENINKSVDEMLKHIDDQLKRLRSGEDYGSYSCGAYFLSDDKGTSLLAANTYKALMSGEGSSVECSAVNTWDSDSYENKTRVDEIKKYLQRFAHPVFAMFLYDSEKNIYQAIPHTPATIVSGSELPLHMGLPTKSVYGLPVIEHAEFGRNTIISNGSDDEKLIDIGNIYHMGAIEDVKVRLDLQSLAMHTFVTGSTGSGKSNTVYNLLNKLREKHISFLVVEPAKGEYKHIWKENINVYGTNPKITPLLKLNPFSFPDETHILEHLDRLIEIFNVCWPMYAAMPAVLKSAIEKSYEDCGWDLIESTNPFGENMYPTFADVAKNVKTIIDNSEYDGENKGAYKGSLLTRLQSLTNGINGTIFTTNEISGKELFDRNVIVDLSRVGSSETKSLIMGMLVLKLQEYRMASDKMNSPLKHVTVLEEAHNLLKRTSNEQSAEGGNLLGKSVEMISNAIAEMRTYGEGFIIADQAPALLDMAAIRNTNTKIIMRLPDQSDRELVGKAANLNNDQIKELAKLPCGVAAIYQNEWTQPVLCKIEKYSVVDGSYIYNREKSLKKNCISDELLSIAKLLSNGTKLKREAILTDILPKLRVNGVRPSIQVAIVGQLENPPSEPCMIKLAPIMSALFPMVKAAVISAYKESYEASEWTIRAEKALLNNSSCEISDLTRRDIIQAIITDYIYIDLGNQEDMQKWAEKGDLQ